jgi:hypothetical protein
MRHIALVAAVMLASGAVAAGQGSEPKLTRQERAALQAIVAAVDASASAPHVSEAEWPIHLLRASDGSHYVAFTAPARGLDPDRPVVVYVRLASWREPGVITTAAERSAVGEWLAGQRSVPVPPQRGIAFGEMPTYGAGAIAGRGPGPQSLQLLEMQRARDRERREARERERKAELEGTSSARPANPFLPFEDFDARATATVVSGVGPTLRRSVTAGPGRYELVVGWADPAAKNVAESVRVAKRSLELAPASTSEFALSSIVIADEIGVREAPYAPTEQTAHPYSIAGTEIVPAADDVLSNDDRLALAMQVINARADAAGKPDVVVGFRLFRATAAGEEPLGTIAPQFYNQTTLPADFDSSRGHPLFAAVAIPLRTFKRGAYRVRVMADDRLAGVSATSDVRFTVIGTPASLLREAPPLAAPFRRDALLEPDVLASLVAGLAPPKPSPPVARALDAARERRFVDVIRETSGSPPEDLDAVALRALALYGLGDTPTAVCAPLRQAATSETLPVTVHVLFGACRALEGNDRDAAAAWQASLDARAASPAVAHALAAAHLRLGDAARAVQLLREATAAAPSRADLARALAAALIASGADDDALAVLDRQLAAQPDDRGAQWLLLHALFAQHVRGTGEGATPRGRDRFNAVATAYVAAAGAHATLAREWMGAWAAR